MVERAANPMGKRTGFWLRVSFVTFAVLGTFVTTVMYSYYEALSIWYILPGAGHLDVALSNHYIVLY
jgi:hypothetical protein